ncbi:MAG: hypothetical protein HZB52_15575 [Chloroflexi bacterium]|nr:hypothetical protein [Chloroflexota bacterium]
MRIITPDAIMPPVLFSALKISHLKTSEGKPLWTFFRTLNADDGGPIQS